MSRASIPRESRIREDPVDRILVRQLPGSAGLASWLIGRAFGDGAELLSVERVFRGKYENHSDSGDELARGQIDVVFLANVALEGNKSRVALLIENKVDAKQMEKQGLRYRALGGHGKGHKRWNEFRCALVAPRWYLEQAYPLGDFRNDPCQPVEAQAEALHAVFRAARRLHEFFVRHEEVLKGIPVMQRRAKEKR
jgi:hypothetical protein